MNRSFSSGQLRVGEAGPETACSYHRPETPPRRTLAVVGTMPAMAKPRATYGAWLPNSAAIASPAGEISWLCSALRCCDGGDGGGGGGTRIGWAGLHFRHFRRRRRSSGGERAEDGLNGIRLVQWWDGGQDEDY